MPYAAMSLANDRTSFSRRRETGSVAGSGVAMEIGVVTAGMVEGDADPPPQPRDRHARPDERTGGARPGHPGPGCPVTGLCGTLGPTRGHDMHEHRDLPLDAPATPTHPAAVGPGRATTGDPLVRRVVTCAIWIAGYGLFWQFVWRPAQQVLWVNFAILAGIMLGTLPPARVRPFTAAAALLALAAVLFLGYPQLTVRRATRGAGLAGDERRCVRVPGAGRGAGPGVAGRSGRARCGGATGTMPRNPAIEARPRIRGSAMVPPHPRGA